jgi:hypothetical protein
MKNSIFRSKKRGAFLIIAMPIGFWFFSETIPMAISGLNWVSYRYLSSPSSTKTGILNILDKYSFDRKTISDIKFPLSRKSDLRFDHERFHLQMVGLIKVEKSGTFWIGTESDDGSWIWLDEKKILNNGGLHAREEMKSFIYLKEGIHSLDIEFENLVGEAYLDLFWIPPNGNREPIPFKSQPMGRMIPGLYWLSILFFKISQYWTFFLVPFLLYNLLFPGRLNKENNMFKG